MKLRFLLPSAFFLFCGMISHAQVFEMFYQGFESAESPNYTVTPAANGTIGSTVYVSGTRSMTLTQANSGNVEFVLDTIDFRSQPNLRFISLEFNHIVDATPNATDGNALCKLYYKRARETEWHVFEGSDYDLTSGGTTDYTSLLGFNKYNYNGDWEHPLSNDLWKAERFNLNNVMGPNVAVNERQLLIKFVLLPHASTSTPVGHWYLDNVLVRASESMMVRPAIKMTLYPDGLYHPSSRGARIELEATTTVSEGIDPDSVYLYYRVGADPTAHRLPMPAVTGVANRYRTVIPFYGYDTMMYFYCVARDATGNANMVTFPSAVNSWMEYKCVRGVSQPGVMTEAFTGTTQTSYFPFPAYCNNRSQWIFDSALMNSAGYGPGSITALTFSVAGHTNTVTRPRFQIKMSNVPTDYHPDTSIADQYYFERSYMAVVYDSVLTINEANAGTPAAIQTINFQDTFFYAGKDILVQVTYSGNSDDITSTSVKTIPVLPGKPTIWMDGYETYEGSPFNPSSSTYSYGMFKNQKLPAMVPTEHANLPLFYDMGFDTNRMSPHYGLVTPDSLVPMTPNDHSLKVRLKNFGAMTANAIRISYSIDSSAIAGFYDWNGSLSAGAIEMLTLASNLTLGAGCHTVKVWVEDTLTSGSAHYRDHEPYNDTIFSKFIVCEGPLSGLRTVGGTAPDYKTVDDLLFAMSSCGVADSLIVRLAPGEYTPFTIPVFNSAADSDYVVFEPRSGMVVFKADTTTTSSSIIDLTNVKNIRFRNVHFVRQNGPLTDMVTLGMSSHNCHFENCQFVDSLDNPSASMRISAMINTGFSNGLYVDSCTFTGGNIGVDVRGQATDILSLNNTVKHSIFYNQTENAVKVQNQNNVVIDGNEMYDVTGSSSYVLYLNECYGASRVMSNRIYTSHGAGAVGVNNAIGTSTTRFLMANNMLVCEDDGTASQLRSPFNIMQSNWADFVYNSVKMVAASNHSNVAATTFGSASLRNSQFINNIVVSLDNVSYALNYSPGSETTNVVGHNVYYSNGSTLIRKSGTAYPTLDAWREAEPNDTASISVNPNFLNGSLVDLRTYNRLVKGVGTPIAAVTTDIYDSLRSTTATCPGAFEFISLAYDFEPEALVSPEAVTCYMPSQVELKVRVRNSGVNGYSGTGLTISYQVNNGTVHTVNVTDSIPPEDTITISTNEMLSLPANGTHDAEYQITVSTTFAADPNQTNDQNTFTVISKYHPAKPANILDSVDYAMPATITPVTGIESWDVYDNTTAPQRQSAIYWYRDTNDAGPFHIGSTLVTDSLRTDTTIYFRQRRAQPIVRITQVEITKSNSTTGSTVDMPYWMSNSRKTALQLTNVGDERANLYGDTIVTVSPTSSLNNKIFVFTDSVFINPGQSLVVQYATGTSIHPAATIHTGFAITVNANAKVGFLYRRGGVLEDAVALNGVTSETVWTNLNVPSYIWSGAGVTITPSTSAGIVRSNFVGNATDWYVATSSNPMFLNTIDPDWIRYIDNGCEGQYAEATILLIAPPSVDLSVSQPILPESACGMGMEDVSVTVHNFGINPVDSIVLNYTAGTDTVTELVPDVIPANGAITYTFTTQLNMTFDRDSTVNVIVWADSVAGDPMLANDTNSGYATSYYTPGAPGALATRIVEYATRDTIGLPDTAGLIPVWYDYSMNPIDTGNYHVSEILYVGGTRGMSYMVVVPSEGQIGTGTLVNNKTGFPTPYQPNAKYAKQQYIYSASELRASGLEEGNIATIAFDLDSIYGTRTEISFNDYYISMGLTSDTIFANNTAWKSTSVVYHRSPMTISRADCDNWMSHTLDIPFYWDGVSSVVVQIVHRIDTAYNSGVQTRYTTKANTAISKNGSSELSPSTMEFTGSGTRSGYRPNTRFENIRYGCEGPITPYEVQLINVPAVDMALIWPSGMDTIDFNSCGVSALHVNVRNQGANTADTTPIYYYFDTLDVDSTIVTTSIAPGATQDIVFMNRHLTPGRHTVTVVVSAPGDNITSNDTLSMSFMARFCGGTYVIAPEGGDYSSFGEAIDTLNVAGIEGPVTFNVAAGTYNEQVRLSTISGSSSTNTVSFVGTGDSVLLTAATSQNLNYVMFLDSAFNVNLSNFRIEARPASGNFANALIMRKGGNITVSGCTVRVKGTINNANASCLILQEGISHLTLTANVLDSGYYSIKTTGTEMDYTDIILNNNIIKNFNSQGVNMRGVTNVNITSNRITSGVTVNGRGLRGIYLGQSAGSVVIQKNTINLIDDKNGGKLGIMLTGLNCSASNPAFVVNNMISCSGTGTQNLSPQKPSGIWIDSMSTNVSVLYNTVRVYCGPFATATYSDASYAFYVGNYSTSNIHVQNNIFSNFSKGYAYYVASATAVSPSNYNAYYTVSQRPFAWGSAVNIANLTALQAQNSGDANSLFEEPYFVADDDLHLVMTNFSTKAQYTTDVTDDIDGHLRFEIPGPTIGAHEMPVSSHDMAVVRITEPLWPANINSPTHVESDSVRVTAEFYNNGLSVETDVQWYAYIEGHMDSTRTPNMNLGTFNPSQSKTASVMLPTYLGWIDSTVVHVVVVLPGDTSLADNDRTSTFYLAPAYNLKAERMSTDHTGCNMQEAVVSITVKNVGFKDFPSGTLVKIGYEPTIHSPAGVNISSLPGVIEEDNVPLPATLLTGQSATLTFATTANLYPTDTAVNLKVRLRGWCKYQYDVSPANDSTGATNNNESPLIDSYYTPDAPIGHDTTFNYGTWGEVTAEQVNSRPIRWHRDSTASAFYHPTQYNASRRWSNTPQYFHDSTYYLQCFSDKNCPSTFSEVHVHVAPLKQNDMAFEAIRAPLGGRVYMENDTVRLRIANYGTRTQNNVPVTYQLKRGNNILQTVTETVPVAIPAGDTLLYTFDSLLSIPTPTQTQNYVLTVWTDLPTDQSRRNDTIRTSLTFRSLSENTYATTTSSSPSFDITRVSFNEIDFDCPPMSRGFTNLAGYNEPREYPTLHVTKGLTDSLIVQVTPLDITAQSSRVMVWAMIDFNRNGVFEPANGEELVSGVTMYDNAVFSEAITISNNASYGYMRMRVAVGSYADFSSETDFSPTQGFPTGKDGCFIDFLIFVDAAPQNADLAVAQIVSPRNYLVRDNNPKVISFRALNKGTVAISNPQFSYSFVGDTVDPTAAGTVSYPGTILPGHSAVVSLPAHSFPLGTTSLTITGILDGDLVPANNVLNYEYHRFHTIHLALEDDFEGEQIWYAPTGYNEYSRNFWEHGMPSKPSIPSANSDSNAWVTSLTSTIVTGKRGSVSYLYSPIIDIPQIKPDTISVYIRRNLGSNGSSLILEYYNYEGNWVKADLDSATNWYNDADNHVFNGNTNGQGYNYYWLAANSLVTEFNEHLQFRFVYTTPIGNSATSSYGGGCAVDDIRIGRARRPIDPGVMAITYPVAPSYGQTIYPKVVVKNYGTDTLRSFTIGYTHYGTYLPKQSSFTCALPPNAVDTFTMTSAMVVTRDFPEEFYITAFTFHPDDRYNDNDTITRWFNLMPLENDISAQELVYPLDNVIAGDTAVRVTLRIRNFGQNAISTATATYIVNGVERVDEQLDFEQLLGHPLMPMDYFNYTFERRLRANMGLIRLVGIIKSPQNDYLYNDTVSKRVLGITSVTDLAAGSVIVDTSSHSDVRIVLAVENRGARGANNFAVGYFIDNDTANARVEIFSTSLPLPALTTAYYTFDRALPRRPGGYNIVAGFVHIDGDNDSSNDTTDVQSPLVSDLECVKLIVEEKSEPDCRVFMQIRNVGNVSFLSGNLQIKANINGNSLSTTSNRRIEPGQTLHIPFNRRIPKSPTRQYVGTGMLMHGGDRNEANNQTSLIEVINYFDPTGVPVVDGNDLLLDQNYPNPFTGRTTVPFTLPTPSTVRFFIVDAMGHIVNSFERFYEEGFQTIEIDMDGYSSGIYYYGIEVNGERRMKKMIMR